MKPLGNYCTAAAGGLGCRPRQREENMRQARI
jgi:hypothetical protein